MVYEFGPKKTPLSLKILLSIIIFFSLISAILISSFDYAGIQHLFFLSQKFFQGFYWQPATYLFFHPSYGLDFSFLFHLAFNLYLIWFFGSSLIERFGTLPFCFLYFFSGLSGCIAQIGLMSLNMQPALTPGTTISLYGILIAWALINPRAELRLLFAIPFKACFLIYFFIGLNLLLNLINLNLINLSKYLSAILFSFLYSIFVYKITFHESTAERLKKRFFNFFKKPKKRKTKIYDFQTGDLLLNDDEFMDEMLKKISLHGEESLTKEEKHRMENISKKRKK